MTECKDDELLTVQEFCNRVRISRGTFYNLKAKGLLPPTIMIGGKRFVRAALVEGWIRSFEMAA